MTFSFLSPDFIISCSVVFIGTILAFFYNNNDFWDYINLIVLSTSTTYSCLFFAKLIYATFLGKLSVGYLAIPGIPYILICSVVIGVLYGELQYQQKSYAFKLHYESLNDGDVDEGSLPAAVLTSPTPGCEILPTTGSSPAPGITCSGPIVKSTIGGKK